MTTRRLIAIMGVSLLVLNNSKLTASDLVTYQGKLTDAASAPLPDGQYRIGVRIWDVASGGNVPLWARRYDVPVQGGLFSVMIGSTGIAWDDPAPLTASLKLALSGISRFVEITVMSDAGQPEKPSGEWKVLSPRQALSAVPYAMNGVPPGTVVPFAGTVVPDGWLLCDGASYSTTDRRYAALFATIQSAYGSGAGMFRIPDLRGRVVMGAGQGSGLSNRLLAQNIGQETHILSEQEMPSHVHTGRTNTDGAHAHTIDIEYWRSNSSNNYNHPGRSTAADGGWIRHVTNNDGVHFHDFTTNPSGGNQPHNIVQPSLVLNYIIKL